MKAPNLIIVWLVLSSGASAARFDMLGDFLASGVSADGNIVVGTGYANGGNEPVLWQNGVLTQLGKISNSEHTFARNISADGTTIIGEDYNVIAFRWTEQSGYESLPPLGIPWATSADGSVIVGQSVEGAFRWTQGTGPVYVPEISGGAIAESAIDVSLDGSVLVGNGSADGGRTGVIYRWQNEVTATPLAEFPYGVANGAAATNSTGSIVVGSVVLADGEEAFRWTESDGLVGLGHLPDHEEAQFAPSSAVATTDDGRLIVGHESVGQYQTRAFAWTSEHGIQPLDAFLRERFDLNLTGWSLDSVADMTADGRVLIGQASHQDFGDNLAFRIEISQSGDFNGDGIVDAADYVLWRKNDGNQSGFDIWRAHFDQMAGTGSGAETNGTVPEPATSSVLLVVASVLWPLKRTGISGGTNASPATRVPLQKFR
jgi:uncharacterized membrane protein